MPVSDGVVPLSVPVGYRVGGWEVTGLIAAGGWATVYAAVGEDGTEAALKFIGGDRLSLRQRAVLTETIEHEVAFSRRDPHPRLVRPFEVCVVDDPERPELHGATVLAMERGATTLRDLIADGVPADAERLLVEVAEGLAHLHGAGFVHGDLKPSNVLIRADGSACLADFGLTREVEGTHAYAPPQHGSTDYLPPEWWTEQVSDRGVATRPSGDVWAFGVTAHQALAGGLFPFPGATAQARTAAMRAYTAGREDLRLNAEVPERWRSVITDCLAPDHARRSAFPAEAIAERAHLAASGLEVVTVVGRRRRRPVVAGAVVAAVLGLAGVAIALTRDDNGPPARSADEFPCDRDQVTRLNLRVQYCPIFEPGTPVYDSPDRGNDARVVGTLRVAGLANWFIGQDERSVYRRGTGENRWWAYTVSDDDTFG